MACETDGGGIKRCRRGRMVDPKHVKPSHIDFPLPYELMDTSDLLTVSVGGIQFSRQDVDEKWLVRDGRIYEIRLGGTRFIPAPKRDFDDIELN